MRPRSRAAPSARASPEVKHLSNGSQPAAPVKRHHGNGAATHKTSKAVSGTAGKHPAKGQNAKTNGTHSTASGKPTSSPASSSHAATGKGIAGTQHSTHGKAGAPGQVKTKTNNGKAIAKGKTEHAAKTPPATAHTTPQHVNAPAKPVTPPGQAKQQTTESLPPAVPPVTTVTDPTAGAVNGHSKK